MTSEWERNITLFYGVSDHRFCRVAGPVYSNPNQERIIIEEFTIPFAPPLHNFTPL